MIVALIAAMARNRVIGNSGQLPWHLPADLKRFKALTLGYSLIIGRKTWESIGRPLPGRRMIVVSRRQLSLPENVTLASSLDSAIAKCRNEAKVFIGGGAQIYSLALPLADEMYLTHIDCKVDGDTFFPSIDDGVWKKICEEKHHPDAENPYAYSFVYYRKTDAVEISYKGNH